MNYPYYRFKELNTLCVEPDACPVYGAPVRAYWREAETAMIQGMSAVLRTAAEMEDPARARQYITDYCNLVQDKAFSDARQLLNDVLWAHSRNSNTMKNGRNPETYEILNELKPIPPMELRLDAAEWQRLLDSLNTGLSAL